LSSGAGAVTNPGEEPLASYSRSKLAMIVASSSFWRTIEARFDASAAASCSRSPRGKWSPLRDDINPSTPAAPEENWCPARYIGTRTATLVCDTPPSLPRWNST